MQKIFGTTLLLAFCGWALLCPVVASELDSRDFEPSQEVFGNPERGLYVQLTARSASEAIEHSALDALRKRGVTLVLRMYYLTEFRQHPISDAWLDLVADDLKTARKSGVKFILRFAYNARIGDPDASLECVLQHMNQLQPILRQSSDVIAVAQAGFVGPWGEWHASTNGLDQPESANAILDKWLKILPPSRFVQVRTPRIKQMILKSKRSLAVSKAYGTARIARIAHHNDCFLANESDEGTYENVATEKAYLERETKFLPVGGETCSLSSLVASENARREFKRFHWSYLHESYHGKVIAGWRADGFLKEIERSLGYRFEMESASVSKVVTTFGALQLKSTLRNVGWAAPFNPRLVKVVLRSQRSDKVYAASLAEDPRHWFAGEKVELDVAIGLAGKVPPSTYDVLLWLPDPVPALQRRAAYAIRFANPEMWDATTGFNRLGLSVTVNEGPRPDKTAETPSTTFAPLLP